MRGHKVKERFPTHEISRGGIECAMATVQYRKLFPASSASFFSLQNASVQSSFHSWLYQTFSLETQEETGMKTVSLRLSAAMSLRMTNDPT